MTPLGAASGTDCVTEVEFAVSDPRYPLVAIPDETGGRATVMQLLPRGDCGFAVFYSFTGVSPDRAQDAIDDHEDLPVRIISRRADSGIVEVVVEDPDEHFVVALCDAGAIPRDLWSADGTAHLVAEIPTCETPSDVVERFLAAHPTVDIVARRQSDRAAPLFTRRELDQAVDAMLTPRQREVLVTAYHRGYFESPREQSGTEIADELGVTQPTFSQHLRIAERRVFSLLFADEGG